MKVNYPCYIGPELDMPDLFVQGKDKIKKIKLFYPEYNVDLFQMTKMKYTFKQIIIFTLDSIHSHLHRKVCY